MQTPHRCGPRCRRCSQKRTAGRFLSSQKITLQRYIVAHCLYRNCLYRNLRLLSASVFFFTRYAFNYCTSLPGSLRLLRTGGALWVRARSVQRSSTRGWHSSAGSRESDHASVGANEQHLHLQWGRGHCAELRVLIPP